MSEPTIDRLFREKRIKQFTELAGRLEDDELFRAIGLAEGMEDLHAYQAFMAELQVRIDTL